MALSLYQELLENVLLQPVRFAMIKDPTQYYANYSFLSISSSWTHSICLLIRFYNIVYLSFYKAMTNYAVSFIHPHSFLLFSKRCFWGAASLYSVFGSLGNLGGVY